MSKPQLDYFLEEDDPKLVHGCKVCGVLPGKFARYWTFLFGEDICGECHNWWLGTLQNFLIR